MEMPEQRPKVDKREYTFMIIPHRGEKVYSWSIQIGTLKTAAKVLVCCIGLFVVGLGYQSYNAYKISKDAQELQSLRANRDIQEQKLHELAKEANAVQKQINEIDKLESEVKKALADPEGGAPSRGAADRPRTIDVGNGQGGPEALSADVLMTQVANLKSELNNKKTSLQSLRERLEARNTRLMATPSIWPTDGTITSRFGYRSSPWGIGSTYHEGIDIASSYGEPIYATADGVVTMSEWNGGYGRYVEIDHGYGLSTAYGHNSQNVVSAGEHVRRGQLIAYVGNSGNSTGPHCHYEVRLNGQQIDPTRFLPM